MLGDDDDDDDIAVLALLLLAAGWLAGFTPPQENQKSEESLFGLAGRWTSALPRSCCLQCCSCAGQVIVSDTHHRGQGLACKALLCCFKVPRESE